MAHVWHTYDTRMTHVWHTYGTRMTHVPQVTRVAHVRHKLQELQELLIGGFVILRIHVILVILVQGFWMVYELFTGGLGFALLNADDPTVMLGSLLLRLASRSSSNAELSKVQK